MAGTSRRAIRRRGRGLVSRRRADTGTRTYGAEMALTAALRYLDEFVATATDPAQSCSAVDLDGVSRSNAGHPKRNGVAGHDQMAQRSVDRWEKSVWHPDGVER